MTVQRKRRPAPTDPGATALSSKPPRPGGAPAAEAGRPPVPPHRRLRVFAFDPSLAADFETSGLEAVTLQVPWEESFDEGLGRSVLRGPVGSYLEVIDRDPASRAFYPPVELNDPYLLARDGHDPSESNPQFHQQMVYAVAMTTIRHFENALGRVALWSDRPYAPDRDPEDRFVERLRVYPHAIRGANAYYSPERKALLFGYFPAAEGVYDAGVAPGTTVFTCLSYDVIAHETAHALLDGMHARFVEPTHPDVLALHEAFADVVAIFQHFTHPELLHRTIAETRGDLWEQNRLAELARQMGRAMGWRSALRNALDPERKPDPAALEGATEPHQRGSILVAALFDAFLQIYRSRAADLLRIATGGTGVLPEGEIHPDLVRRLAHEAATTARHVLHMCIRALDYCPPVGIDFGDYLRALITADLTLVPYDQRNYRAAVIEAFRVRGILPRGLRGLSEESLRWQRPASQPPAEALAPLFEPIEGRRRGGADAASPLRDLVELWTLGHDRRRVWTAARRLRGRLQRVIAERWPAEWAQRELHLVLEPTDVRSVYRDRNGRPATEVHSARIARRRGPRDEEVVELVVEITQRRRGYFDAEHQRAVDRGQRELGADDHGDFPYRSGCTLLIDLGTREVRYAIRAPGPITGDQALDAQRRFRAGLPPGLRATYLGDERGLRREREPFAFLHGPTATPR
ncbi:MAG TPA: hypothetical protein VMV46_03465 [Thermoanaerobaculia bacterium]|nr:hypothetical protein [Thermoanaerobaculia bacterium]